jgi:hypothetical protein
MRRPKQSGVDLASLVVAAQAGDVEARKEIYDRFEWFLVKYKSFFRSESDAIRLAKQYPDIAAFLGLFTGKKTYNAVRARNWSPGLTDHITRKVNEVVELAREIGEEGDIGTIIDMTFYELLSKYDDKGKVRKELKKDGIEYDTLSDSQKRRYDVAIPPVGFEGYLMNVFKWRLFKNIEAESKGVIPGVGWCKSYVTYLGSNEGDAGFESTNLAEHLSEETVDFDDILASFNHIDEDWVNGSGCGHPFNLLTQQERWILKMRFADGMSSRDIGESIGASPSVVRSRFNDIMQTLRHWVTVKHIEARDGTQYQITTVKDANSRR